MERDLQRPTTSPGRSSQHVVTGRWLFSFAVSAPRPLPPADVGRAISARGREGSFCTFSTSKVVTMLRAYASRVGVFLRDFLSFFSRVAARSGVLFLACTNCVSGRLLAKDFSCGGGAVRLSATRSPRSSRAFWRVYFRSRRKSPPSICTDLPVPKVSHAIENQLEDDLHPPFLASSCRKATPLPFEQDQLLWPPPSHRYSSRVA